jgi:hypothetical protein
VQSWRSPSQATVSGGHGGRDGRPGLTATAAASGAITATSARAAGPAAAAPAPAIAALASQGGAALKEAGGSARAPAAFPAAPAIAATTPEGTAASRHRSSATRLDEHGPLLHHRHLQTGLNHGHSGNCQHLAGTCQFHTSATKTNFGAAIAFVSQTSYLTCRLTAKSLSAD